MLVCCPRRHQALGSRAPFLTNRIELEGCDARDACLSASAEEGMEDDGFEFETTLREKSNVFAFPIEDAQDLDFFDQPKLSPKEIAEVPFGLKTSSAPLRSTPRPKRTTK
jgi:hypothetical protein